MLVYPGSYHPTSQATVRRGAAEAAGGTREPCLLLVLGLFWVKESGGLGLHSLWPRRVFGLPAGHPAEGRRYPGTGCWSWAGTGRRLLSRPPPPSGPGGCQIIKSRPGLKKEIFINNLNNNTVDLNGHTLEAYRMVRKEAWGLAAVLGGPGGQGRGWSCREKRVWSSRGLWTGRAGGALYNRNRKGAHFRSFRSRCCIYKVRGVFLFFFLLFKFHETVEPCWEPRSVIFCCFPYSSSPCLAGGLLPAAYLCSPAAPGPDPGAAPGLSPFLALLAQDWPSALCSPAGRWWGGLGLPSHCPGPPPEREQETGQSVSELVLSPKASTLPTLALRF